MAKDLNSYTRTTLPKTKVHVDRYQIRTLTNLMITPASQAKFLIYMSAIPDKVIEKKILLLCFKFHEGCTISFHLCKFWLWRGNHEKWDGKGRPMEKKGKEKRNGKWRRKEIGNPVYILTCCMDKGALHPMIWIVKELGPLCAIMPKAPYSHFPGSKA